MIETKTYLFFQLLLLSLKMWQGVAFVFPLLSPRHISTLLQATAASKSKTTLTEDTSWKVQMVLRGLKTTQGKRLDELFTLSAQFLEDNGFEPPQGRIQLLGDSNRLELTNSYWKLSEDPEDRKDGLWVWGLFKEPLYPFLLLQMETSEIQLVDDDSIPPLQLYAQINHKRDDSGVVLEGSYSLKTKRSERYPVDIFGAASVDLFEDVDVGTIRIEPER